MASLESGNASLLNSLPPALEEVLQPVEEVIESLEISIDKKLHTKAKDSYRVCIYRVSEKHRKINEEAYTPRLVSIGPIHHGKSQLQAMESYKLRCLQSFKMKAGTTIGDLIRCVAEKESSARGCYEDTVQFSSKKFSEMMLLDGVFIIEILLKNKFHNMRDKSDVLFDNTWLADDVLHDMLLLENQLPINILEGLFKFVEVSFVQNFPFLKLASEYFKDVGNTSKLQLTEKCARARNFVEFLVYLHQPSQEIQVEAPRPGKFE